MAFYKKTFNSRFNVWYPSAIVKGKPVETEEIAADLADISTVSNSDVQAVLGDIAKVIHRYMAQGKSVHIKGLGYFRYTLDTDGVADKADFNFDSQVKGILVQFTPEKKLTNKGDAYTRALVDSKTIEWIELGASEADDAPATETGGTSDTPTGETGGQDVNPLS